MNFDYNEEQQLLADSVRRFLQKDYDFEKRKASLQNGWSEEVWSTFAEMGLLVLPLPAEYGGFGGGAVDLMSVMEAFGEALVVEPYVPTVLGALAVAKGGNEKQKKEILPLVAQGKLRLALATGPRGVLGAPLADRIVFGSEGRLRIVGRDEVQARAFRTVDDLAAGDIRLDGKGESLAGGVLDEVLDLGAALTCAEAVGAMKFACETTLEYLKTRKQFGVPIGAFQALQHRMVDMFISYEQAKSMACLA